MSSASDFSNLEKGMDDDIGTLTEPDVPNPTEVQSFGLLNTKEFDFSE